MFNQLWILWGLPLAALPLIIHLLNRLRYRSLNWAAMMFLLSATRNSTRQARLKQFLILLCRVLAIVFLILALSRPRLGGWLGLALSGPPETVILLLDRSASMEEIAPGARKSKRARALEVLTRAIEQNGPGTRLILIENVLKTPQEIKNPELLADLPLTQGTDTAADLPAMLEAALTYLVDNSTGKTEIWLASDLQRSNWLPESNAWPTLMAQFNNLARDLRVRLLVLEANNSDNVFLIMKDLVRYRNMGKAELKLAFDVVRTPHGPTSFPVTLELAGRPPEDLDLSLEGASLAVQHRLRLGREAKSGWGKLSLPVDANHLDNTAWFVFGEERTLKTAIVSKSLKVSRFLKLAAGPAPESMNQEAKVYQPEQLAELELKSRALVVWQGAFPPSASEAERRLKEFVAGGGVLLCFPGHGAGGKLFGQLSWGELENIPNKKFLFGVSHWDTTQGPLANSVSGEALPLSELKVYRRRRPLLAGEVLGEFSDGTPFLSRLRFGQGAVLACATLPGKDWSTLHFGPVLVPMVQRLLQQGAKRLSASRMAVCGEFQPGKNEDWRPVPETDARDVRWQAGVYKLDSRLLALNRPGAEDLPAMLTDEEITPLFGGLPCYFFREKAGEGAHAVPSEVWRVMLYLMLAVLLAESLLTLPARQPGQPGQSAGPDTVAAAGKPEVDHAVG